MTHIQYPSITITEGRLVTTSLEVAKHFGKIHKNVLRDIKRILQTVPAGFNPLNFEPVPYTDSKNESRPMYIITRDGFSLLAMGFTGREAMEWKIKFLETFNRMEQSLRAVRTIRAVRMEETLFKDHPRWEMIRDALEIGYPMEMILRLTGYKNPSSIRCQAKAMERYGLLERRKGWKEQARWRIPRSNAMETSINFSPSDHAIRNALEKAHHELCALQGLLVCDYADQSSTWRIDHAGTLAELAVALERFNALS
ncbi:MAG: Rha family transcriptional regulator [Magnetococcales bacterium]|nr:Rha family transcriptional regulator [Magnetococcales bacterium]